MYILRLVHEFSDLFKYILCTYLTYVVVLLSKLLLQIQKSVFVNDWMMACRSTLTMGAVLVWFFIICETGNDITHRFSRVGDSIYNCAWYNLPLKLKKYIPTMIAITQKPLFVQGFGNIRCTRETLKTVMRYSFLSKILFFFYIFHMFLIVRQ